MDETTLMLKVKKGHLDSMRFLFDQYNKRLYSYFIRLTRDPATSEDLAQNVFYRALRYRNSFNPEHGFNAWIFQIARNVFHDYHKKQKKLPISGEDSGELIVADNNDEAQRINEQEVKLNKAIKQLKPDEQEIIELHRFQKLKYEEVARITGSTTAAVKMKAHRTMKRLKEVFFQLHVQ